MHVRIMYFSTQLFSSTYILVFSTETMRVQAKLSFLSIARFNVCTSVIEATLRRQRWFDMYEMYEKRGNQHSIGNTNDMPESFANIETPVRKDSVKMHVGIKMESPLAKILTRKEAADLGRPSRLWICQTLRPEEQTLIAGTHGL